MSLVISGAKYVVVSADCILPGADVYVQGDRIRAVGHPDEIRRLCADEQPETIDASGGIVIPGMINAHTHLYQNCLKGLGDGLSLRPWCEQVLFPFVDRLKRLSPDGYDQLGYAWAVLGTIEMIKSGITCCINMDVANDAVPRAWADLGFRGVMAPQLADRWVPDDLVRTMDETRLEMIRWLTEWRGMGGVVDVFLAPSTVFTCTRDLLRSVREIAGRFRAGTQIHVSETRWEVEDCVRELGSTPLVYLKREGFLDGRVTLVHCVHLTPEEMDLAARRDAVCVYNPKSNMRLGSGVAPIPDLLSRGVPIALATDGAASNDLLDFFEEMRCGLFLQRAAREDSSALTAGDIFRMATEGGARAAGIQAGKVAAGHLADLVIVNPALPHKALSSNPINALVYCAKSQDVRAVIIAGRVVMADGEIRTIDEKNALASAESLVQAMIRNGP